MVTIPGGAIAAMNDVGQPANGKPAKIHEAAQQFEALMVGEMLKSARESSDSEGWLGSGESTGDDSAMEMAESQFANALAHSGGLGLAKVIERAMSKPATEPQKLAETPQAVSGASSKNP